MDSNTTEMLLDVTATLFLVGGILFMTLAPLGLLRLPDFYNRMHAATKAITLGIVGLLIAGAIKASTNPDVAPIEVITKILLVIMFQFVANPVGAHLLSKAAHLDGCPKWSGTISDDLDEDRREGKTT